jgi:uncharacterized protein YjbI with pentapeptide repeats
MAENKTDIKSGRVKRLWECVIENSPSLRIKVQKRGFELFFGVLLVGLGLLLFTLWDVFDFSSLIEGASDGTGAQPPVTFSNLSEFIRAAFIGVGVIGGGYGLILAAKRTEKFATQVENSQAQLFNDRLGRGVELLSNDEMIMRSAGVRILENLGETSSPQETALIINMLKDFLNDKGKIYPAKDEDGKDIYSHSGIIKPAKEPNRNGRIDVENCINCILKLNDDSQIDSVRREFTDMDFRTFELRGCEKNPVVFSAIFSDFSETKISLIDPKKIKLECCNISNAIFTDKSIINYEFSGCYGYKAQFKVTKLKETSFIGTNLNRATLQNKISEGVTFDSCRFIGADLTGTTLKDVRFFRPVLYCADFSGADLSGASGITQEEFSKIIYNKDNPPINRPEGLELPEDRVYERRESYSHKYFVIYGNEQLRGRRVSEVLDELLREQDEYYQKSLPPSGG